MTSGRLDFFSKNAIKHRKAVLGFIEILLTFQSKRPNYSHWTEFHSPPPFFLGQMPLVVPFWGSIFVDETVPRHFNSFVLSSWYMVSFHLPTQRSWLKWEREKQTCFSAKPSKTFLRLHILHAYWFTTMSLWNFYLHFNFNSSLRGNCEINWKSIFLLTIIISICHFPYYI